MSNDYASLTLLMPAGQIPDPLASLEDLAPHCTSNEALAWISRRDWMSWAIELCIASYAKPGLSYLVAPAAVLQPREATAAAQELESLLDMIAKDPRSLARHLQQDGWTEEELLAVVKTPVGPWGPLRESDEGDDLPYLLSYLCAHLALLKHASTTKLCVVFARTSD